MWLGSGLHSDGYRLTLKPFSRQGTPTIEYFGIDTAGNVSATLTEPMRP